MNRGGKTIMQPSLFHIKVNKDVVYTPDWLAQDMCGYFLPQYPGASQLFSFLEPCAGDGAFLKYMPNHSQWCEIKKKRDFYAFTGHVDYSISNPPYSHLLAWIEYSFKVADNIIYLLPLHRIWNSATFLDKLDQWGGIQHIRRYGTGTQCGFPFGHAVAAVHFKKGHGGSISKSNYWKDK